MGRRSMGRYQNGNGQSYQEDLPERGPGALIQKIIVHVDVQRFHYRSLIEPSCTKKKLPAR